MWVEPHGSAFRIRDRIGGRVVTVGNGPYPTKTSAKAALALLKADAVRGDALVPRGGTVLLSDLIDEWWPGYRKTLAPGSVQSEGRRIENHIKPLLGHYTLDELADSTVIQQWVEDLENGVGAIGPKCRTVRRPLAPKTVHNCHGLLHTIMNFAVMPRKLIRINPCAGKVINLPKRVKKEMRFLTDPEIGRLIAAVPEHWRPLVILLIATGMRWGEGIGLRVRRVDVLAKRPNLLVVEQLQEMATGELLRLPPKTDRSRRTVSFTKKVALVIASCVAGKASDDLVFLSPMGFPIRRENFRRGWKKWTKAAGLPGLRIHDLRHTHAAVLIAANRPLSAISRRLGHASIWITDALYGHLREEVDEGILDAVDASLALIKAEDLTAALAAELEDELDDADLAAVAA